MFIIPITHTHKLLSEPIIKFLELLNRHANIQNEPVGSSNRVIGLVVKDRRLYGQVMSCSSVVEAYDVYTRALQVLSSHAKEEVAQSCNQNLLIDGRIELDMPVS